MEQQQAIDTIKEHREEIHQKVQGNIRVGFFSSIRARIIFMVVIAIAVCAVLIWFTVQPATTETFSEMQKNYIDDVAIAYGEMLEVYVKESGLECVDTPEVKNMLEQISAPAYSSLPAYQHTPVRIPSHIPPAFRHMQLPRHQCSSSASRRRSLSLPAEP